MLINMCVIYRNVLHKESVKINTKIDLDIEHDYFTNSFYLKQNNLYTKIKEHLKINSKVRFYQHSNYLGDDKNNLSFVIEIESHINIIVKEKIKSIIDI